MRRNKLFILSAIVALCAATWSGCATSSGDGKTNTTNTTTNPATSAAEPAAGKLPITTASDEARKAFLQGRDLADKLLIQDSVQHFDRAISLDPNFAAAHLARANSSPTAKEFFEHLKHAVGLADKASEGERLQILAAEAGANGNTAKQKEHLDKLIAMHPNEERAHFALGGYYFGQQDYAQAIAEYKRATELNPNYSNAFNLLGYAYRQNGDYANAETAFKKYVELIPTDPNPYDSYAELLLKMGRFDESIAQYRKALSIQPNFVNSHFATAAALMYQGKHDEATAELQKMTDKARSDGERRTALFGQTVVDVDAGKLDKALEDVDKQYAIAEKSGDVAAMAGDLQNKGTILAEMGKYAEAKEQFERLLKMTEGSSLSQEIKDNTRLFHHYNLATVALGMKDVAKAKAEADEFRKGAKNPAQVRQSHQLDGMIALAEKDYDKAIAELQQTGQQNPQNFYRLCQAYQGKGDGAKAKEFCGKAADFNSLPLLNYAFVRAKARKMAV
ncbi:MAG TPA: tetratricopeptide repeat protein [Pyrinomonadaceae bacterium]|nr:tetratricopeptide repeat protein [Pyrinomonadaceae bacterium]